MALKSQPVIDDVGSEMLAELRRQFNLLLDQIDALGAMESVQDLQTDVRDNVKKVKATNELPASPKISVP